jgi:hypothetical protein
LQARKPLIIKIIVLLCIFIGFSLNVLPVMADQITAYNAISSDQNLLKNSYAEIRDFESTNANVTILVAALSQASSIFSDAQLLYNQGKYDDSISLATQSQTLLRDFSKQADILKKQAIEDKNYSFLTSIIFILTIVSIVIISSYVLWRSLGKTNKFDISKYKILYIITVGLLSTLIVSPTIIDAFLVPGNQEFTQLYILSQEHDSQNYPHIIHSELHYNLTLGIDNHLGYTAFYLVQLKLRNETQPTADRFAGTPSKLKSIYNYTAIIINQATWEKPLDISFSYIINSQINKVLLTQMTINKMTINVSNFQSTWNPTTKEYLINLLLELWLYNIDTQTFQYNQHFLSLNLNMN